MSKVDQDEALDWLHEAMNHAYESVPNLAAILGVEPNSIWCWLGERRRISGPSLKRIKAYVLLSRKLKEQKSERARATAERRKDWPKANGKPTPGV